MGWRSGSKEAPMAGVYFNPQNLDELVEKNHPFLKYWK